MSDEAKVRNDDRDEIREALYETLSQFKGRGISLDTAELAILDLLFQIRVEILQRKGYRIEKKPLRESTIGGEAGES